MFCSSSGMLATDPACLLQGGGVRINNLKVQDEARAVQMEDLIEGRMLLLSAGKKNKLLHVTPSS